MKETRRGLNADVHNAYCMHACAAVLMSHAAASHIGARKYMILMDKDVIKSALQFQNKPGAIPLGLGTLAFIDS